MTKILFKGSTMLNPVPVALITSKSKEGKPNIFTVGWIGTACTKPPMITVAIRPERLSYEYIKDTREFVVNLPQKSLVKKVDYCGVRSGKVIDKISKCNFTLEKAEVVNAPIIKECPVALECKLKEIIPLGSHHLFLAEVVTIQVEEELIDKAGKIHLEKANLICYSHGEYFPIPEKPIGKFGFSVQKKKIKRK
ncbi:Flavoredoxin [Clostridium liquoris]|jgi:flavin reductase (DIM6/NTAB) family NADH-FMN oxidoreductase RutF|uniref:Flavoredoxin n=1 Tax=Clostridium liquoris TaxID=1289519 RepID=A0A2T0B182_9CLOT|nr:flavin reductase family protein [Clostridium liquoris]PRR77392.1 Flavoredoxin [Clostridium liquoris]